MGVTANLAVTEVTATKVTARKVTATSDVTAVHVPSVAANGIATGGETVAGTGESAITVETGVKRGGETSPTDTDEQFYKVAACQVCRVGTYRSEYAATTYHKSIRAHKDF